MKVRLYDTCVDINRERYQQNITAVFHIERDGSLFKVQGSISITIPPVRTERYAAEAVWNHIVSTLDELEQVEPDWQPIATEKHDF